MLGVGLGAYHSCDWKLRHLEARFFSRLMSCRFLPEVANVADSGGCSLLMIKA